MPQKVHLPQIFDESFAQPSRVEAHLSIDFVGLAGPGEIADPEHATRIFCREQKRMEESGSSVM